MKKTLMVFVAIVIIAYMSGCIESQKPISSFSALVSDSEEIPEESASSALSPASVLESKISESSEEIVKPLNYQVSGKYICNSDIYKAEFFEGYSEAIPAVIFNEDGRCELIVNYMEGLCSVYGTYCVQENQVIVNVNLDGTIFEESGTKYMNDQYVFKIMSNNEIVIDRGYYAVKAGDKFIKS